MDIKILQLPKIICRERSLWTPLVSIVVLGPVAIATIFLDLFSNPIRSVFAGIILVLVGVLGISSRVVGLVIKKDCVIVYESLFFFTKIRRYRIASILNYKDYYNFTIRLYNGRFIQVCTTQYIIKIIPSRMHDKDTPIQVIS